MGHAEAAAAMSSLTKVIIAMETGFIPPNINLTNLRKDIDAFQSGRIKVCKHFALVCQVSRIHNIQYFLGSDRKNALERRHRGRQRLRNGRHKRPRHFTVLRQKEGQRWIARRRSAPNRGRLGAYRRRDRDAIKSGELRGQKLIARSKADYGVEN